MNRESELPTRGSSRQSGWEQRLSARCLARQRLAIQGPRTARPGKGRRSSPWRRMRTARARCSSAWPRPPPPPGPAGPARRPPRRAPPPGPRCAPERPIPPPISRARGGWRSGPRGLCPRDCGGRCSSWALARFAARFASLVIARLSRRRKRARGDEQGTLQAKAASSGLAAAVDLAADGLAADAGRRDHPVQGPINVQDLHERLGGDRDQIDRLEQGLVGCGDLLLIVGDESSCRRRGELLAFSVGLACRAESRLEVFVKTRLDLFAEQSRLQAPQALLRPGGIGDVFHVEPLDHVLRLDRLRNREEEASRRPAHPRQGSAAAARKGLEPPAPGRETARCPTAGA